MKTEDMNVLPVTVLTDLACYREVSDVSSVVIIADPNSCSIVERSKCKNESIHAAVCLTKAP